MRATAAATVFRTAAGLCLAVLAGCVAEPPGPLPFRAGSVEHHPEGGVALGFLAAPTTIAGLPCRGWVRLRPDGGLASFELAAAATVQGHALPAASYVWFDDAGRLQTCFLACDTVLQGYVCRGGPFQTATSFHENGALHAFFPRDDVTIDGVVCTASNQAPVYLHDNGRLAKCRIAADFTSGGRTLRRADTIEFDADGRLVDGTAGQPGVTGR
jgi:hypothetical protein